MAYVFGALIAVVVLLLIHDHMSEISVALIYVGFIGLIVYFVRNPQVFRRIWEWGTSGGIGNNDTGMQSELETLRAELHYKLNESAPFTVKGMEVRNEEIRMITEKIRLLTDQVGAVNTIEERMQNYEADNTIRRTELKPLIQDKLTAKHRERIKDSLRFENDIKQMRFQNLQLKSNMSLEEERADHQKQLRAHDVESYKTDIDRKKAEIYEIRNHSDVEMLLAMANVNLKNARTIREIDETGFIKDVLTKIDVQALPPELQAYIIACVFNKDTGDYDQYNYNLTLREIMDMKAKADVNKTNAEAKKIKSEARFKTYEADGVNSQNKHQEWKHREAKKRWN